MFSLLTGETIYRWANVSKIIYNERQKKLNDIQSYFTVIDVVCYESMDRWYIAVLLQNYKKFNIDNFLAT